jgi:acetate kinase
MNILVINCGSSSIKYKFYSFPREALISKGALERIGEKESPVKNHPQGLRAILSGIDKVDTIGHRVVHGAQEFKEPTLINRKVIRKVRECCRLAPLHNPANLEGIIACDSILKGIKQVAVFDTAFHQTLPPRAFIYGLPYRFYQKDKIRKYGFHGTSHEYVAREAAKKLGKDISKVNLITCHLGNGCSITAIQKGESIDTSMGFTPSEGLLMGTRCGDIDPALITYLIRKKRMSATDVDELLNKESGLKGISGISNDIRKIEHAVKKGNSRAGLAIEIFIYRIRKYIGAYLGILGKADAIVFTAGIGENRPQLAQKICAGLFNNLKVKPKIIVIPTDEELMIARQTYKIASRE